MALPVITNNSPVAGSISWTATNVSWADADWPIAAGNTSDKFVWWEYRNGVPAVVTGNTLPTFATGDMILFINKNGVGALVPTMEIQDGSLLVPGSILASAIAADQIQTHHIDAGAVTATEIAAGAISADHVQAGAIMADKLSVGTVGDNAVVNGSFEDFRDNLIVGWEASAMTNGTIAPVTGVASSGKYSIQFAATNTSANLRLRQTAASFIPVSAASGRKYYVSARMGAGTATTSGSYLRVNWYDANKVYISQNDLRSNGAMTTTFTIYEGQATPPATARYMGVEILWTNINVTSTLYLDEVTVHEVTMAAQIGDGQVTAAKILAGTITADRIASGTITADKIAVSDQTNYVRDPGLEFSGAGWGLPTGGTIATIADPRIDGTKCLQIVAGSSVRDATTGTLTVREGDWYYASCYVRYTGTAPTSTGDVHLGATISIKGGGWAWPRLQGAPANQVPSTWTRWEGIIQMPANAQWMQLRPSVRAETTNGTFQFDDFQLRRMNGGELIVDGAITATKIATNAVEAVHVAANAIDADAIQANAITAGKILAGEIGTNHMTANTINGDRITANTIAADKILANSIGAGQIAANSITAQEIAANAITANEIGANAVIAEKIAALSIGADKIIANSITAGQLAANTITAAQIAANTITAAQIATAAITADEIAAGAITAGKIDADAINGKTIVGATIKTATTGARIEMTTTGLNAWDANNINYLKADNTGLKLEGELTAKGITMGTPFPMTATVGNLDQAGTHGLWNTLGVHFSRDDKTINPNGGYMPPAMTSADGDNLFLTSAQNPNPAGGNYPRSHIYLAESQADFYSDSQGGINIVNTAAEMGNVNIASWGTQGSVWLQALGGSVQTFANEVVISGESVVDIYAPSLRVNGNQSDTTTFTPIVTSDSERDGLFSFGPTEGNAVIRNDKGGITQRYVDGTWTGFAGSVAYVSTQNGYNNYARGYPTTHGYIGPDGRTYLGGMFSITSTGSVNILGNTEYTMGTLPAGYRPPYPIIFKPASSHDLGDLNLYIGTDGTIRYRLAVAKTLNNGNVQFWISLEGISWRNANC